MHVLISAFACAPGRGSEPNVGWETVKQVSRLHQVWVITNARNRPLIQKEISQNPLRNVEFVYLDLPPCIETIARKPGLHQLSYFLWQYKMLQIARSLHHRLHFEIFHHVTYVNSWIPPGIAGLGRPFLWNAGTRETTPWRFLKIMSGSQRISEGIRNLLVKGMGTITEKMVRKNVRYILSGSTSWDKSLPIVLSPIGGLNSAEVEKLTGIPLQKEKRKTLRIASIGRFLGLKGFEMGLHAFARFLKYSPNSEYWLIGNGPEEKRLRGLAQKLKLGSAVTFLPFQPREKLFDILGEVDVLLHPSLHEQFGYVIAEAMAAGRVVICLDVGGPSFLVREDCGLKVPLTSPKLVIDGLADALLALAQEPEHRFTLGERARVHVMENWTWDAVGDRLLELYEQANVDSQNRFSEN